MVADSTEQTIGAKKMETLEEEITLVLTVADRCDSCSARAYVKLIGFSGELTFCAHHYNKITSSKSGKDAVDSFSYELIDERFVLNESEASRTKI